MKENITIEDLYNWAIENECEDYVIKVQFRDSGGDYLGTDEEVYLDINREDKSIIL